jgi:hypothetical protein
MDTYGIEQTIERLNDLYNPERDLIIGAPRVTHTDYKIVEMISDLLSHVKALESRISELEDEASETESKRQLAESVAIWLPTK